MPYMHSKLVFFWVKMYYGMIDLIGSVDKNCNLVAIGNVETANIQCTKFYFYSY